MSKRISQLNELTTVLDADILPVVNSGETKKVTKANLLKEIFTALSGKSDITHLHDDRYYTETEINALLSGKANFTHAHAQTDITGLISALSGKSDTGHNHDDRYYTESEINTLLTGKEDAANKNIAGGYAGLDGAGKILTTQLPALAISDTFVVASQSAMLALAAETGDVAVRTDINKSFILRGNNPGVLGNWQELLTPTDSVQSVNGLTGTVNLTPGIIGAANAVHNHIKTDITDFAHTHLKSEITDFAHNHDDRYYTETEIDSFLAGKANTSHNHLSSQITDLTETIQDTIGSSLIEGANIDISYDDATGQITISSTGGGSPAGSNTYVQYNDGGIYGGDSGFIWNKINKYLGIGGTPSYHLDISGVTGSLNTARFYASGVSGKTKVVIQGTANQYLYQYGWEESVLDILDYTGNHTAFIRQDGFIAGSKVGTSDDITIVMSSVSDTYQKPGVNMNPTAMLIWSSGAAFGNVWWDSDKDTAIMRSGVSELSIINGNTPSIKGDLKLRKLTSTSLATGSTAPTTIGTTKMVITDQNGQLSFDNIPSSGSSVNFVEAETPTGAVNGTNTVFTTANNFIAGSIHFYLNGIRLNPTEYSQTGINQITLTSPPITGDILLIDYRK
jgi:hypothetical protein